MVHIDYKDHEGLRIQSENSAKMGFTGKQVIHPSQIAIVHDSYRYYITLPKQSLFEVNATPDRFVPDYTFMFNRPSDEKVEWAKELIKEFRMHEAQGKGAFTFRGSMIDAPLVKQAENIVGAFERF